VGRQLLLQVQRAPEKGSWVQSPSKIVLCLSRVSKHGLTIIAAIGLWCKPWRYGQSGLR